LRGAGTSKSLTIGIAITPTDCAQTGRAIADRETDAYGIGAAFIFVAVSVSLLPGLAAGKGTARRIAEERAARSPLPSAHLTR
jgi:hypothetical protein